MRYETPYTVGVHGLDCVKAAFYDLHSDSVNLSLLMKRGDIICPYLLINMVFDYFLAIGFNELEPC